MVKTARIFFPQRIWIIADNYRWAKVVASGRGLNNSSGWRWRYINNLNADWNQLRGSTSGHLIVLSDDLCLDLRMQMKLMDRGDGRVTVEWVA